MHHKLARRTAHHAQLDGPFGVHPRDKSEINNHIGDIPVMELRYSTPPVTLTECFRNDAPLCLFHSVIMPVKN